MRKSNIECKLDKELRKKAREQVSKASQLERLMYEDDDKVESNDKNHWKDIDLSNPNELFFIAILTK